MAWARCIRPERAYKCYTKDDPVGGEPPVSCPYCGDSDCDRHTPENNGFSREMARWVGDECPRNGRISAKDPPPKCSYCRDTDCHRHTQEDMEFFREMAPWVRDEFPKNGGPVVKEPGPKCPYCGDSDCDRHTPEDMGFFRETASSICPTIAGIPDPGRWMP